MASAPSLNLTAPEPVAQVTPEQAAAGLVPISDKDKTELEKRASAFIDDLAACDANSPDFETKVTQLTNMGRREISDAARQSNRFLDRPIRAMDKGSAVGTNLAELRRTVTSLDPSGKSFTPKKLLGLIPFGNRMKDYFESYQSAQTHIQEILNKLSSGKDELLKDNAAIDVERQALWTAMGRLQQMIHISQTLDQGIEDRAITLEDSHPAKAKALRESALFYVRQRTQDLLTQLAVSVQGYLALDLVKKNNIELIKGVDRASTTTVSALRTAVTVSQALGQQKLVLNQINALNSTTANLIDSTGTMLKNQTGQIHQQAASTAIPVDTLKRAFQNIYETMDAIDSFKGKALESMKQTVEQLDVEVRKTQEYIGRAEDANKALAKPQEDPFKLT